MKANKLSKRKYKKITRKKLTRKRLTRKRLTRNNYKKKIKRGGTPLFNYKKKIKRGGTPLFKKTSEPIQAPEPRGQAAALRLLQMGEDKRLDTVPEEVLQRIKLDKEIQNKRSDRTALAQSLATKGKESAKTVTREILKKTVPGGNAIFADPVFDEANNKLLTENASKLDNIINLLYELLHRGNTGGISKAAQLESKARPLLKESINKPINNTPLNNTPSENKPENAPINNTPLNNASAENAPAENAPSENAPAENAPENL